MLQRYGDYNIKEIFAFIFSKSNEDKKGITPTPKTFCISRGCVIFKSD